jgi:hypothetical protein
MDRRSFNKLVGLAAMSGLTANVDARAQLAGIPQTIRPGSEATLEDEHLLAAFDRGTGALTRLVRKASSWTIERRPELGASFRLLAPLPERRENFVLGQKQRLAQIEKPSANQLRFHWTNLVSEHGGVLPITFVATVTLEGGRLSFEGELRNDSSLVIETLDYPYLGDLTSPSAEASLHSEHMWYGNLVGDELYPHFVNAKGYWGVDFPTKTIESKQSLFCLIQSSDQGIYVEMRDPAISYLLEYTFEQHPGVLESIHNIVPEENEIGGTPVHLQFRTCHFLFVQPHSNRKLAPVVLQTYAGDWHAGVDLYKAWRNTWFRAGALPAWTRDIHSWQQLQINAPEEDYTIPYRDIMKYANECADNGVTAIQLVGWNRGGQDRGDPSQDTDPGLGTWQELHDAIAQSQAKGVRIILFGKLNWADMTTQWYKDELYKYQATDPYGIPYQQGGYSYFTPTQLAGINNRRRTVMDVLDPQYRDVATREFEKILALGASGWLFDEVCHHGPVEYSFSRNHGYPPPGYIYAGDLPLGRQLREAADKVNREFVFAGEGPQDWLMQYYPVSYFRINAGSRAVCRYIDPEAPLIVAVTGFDDREMLNLILMNRYIISYEPYNFKGQLTDFPLTLAYGTKIDALRRRYRAWIWDAEFRDTLGATVSSDGEHRYSVFVLTAGKRAVVVVNTGNQKSISARVEIPNAGRLVVATPEEPDSRELSGILQVPPRSAAVVMES